MKDCIVYLVWQLRQAGFEVRFTWPNILFISWRHHEGDYLSRQNPIVQAMAPEPRQMPALRQIGGSQKKKMSIAVEPIPASRPTVAYNQDIDLITNNVPYGTPYGTHTGAHSSAPFGGTPFGSHGSQGALRRAADYEPPASFIQNLDRPGPGRIPKEGAKGNVLADLWSL